MSRIVTPIAVGLARRLSCTMTWLLRSPFTTLAAAGGLAFSIYRLPIQSPGPSSVGQLVAHWLGRHDDSNSCAAYDIANFVRRDGAFCQARSGAYTAFISTRNDTEGFWAPTVHTRTVFMFVDAPGLDVHDQQLFRDAAVKTFAGMRRWKIDEQTARDLAAGDATKSVILWRGCLHNLASLACLTVLGASLLCVGAEMKRDRRRHRGRCPHCVYDLRATPLGAPCPECGRLTSEPAQSGT